MTLSDEQLLASLQAWHLTEPLKLQQLPGGMTSEVWHVEAGNQRFIAKYNCTTQQAFESGLHAAELLERWLARLQGEQ